MLEQQQMQLVNGLQELYARIISSRGWEGAPLQNSSNGHPLTHDILERLDALRIDGHVDSARFEEDPEVLQKRLISEGALSMQRQESMDSDSAHDQVSLREDTSPKPFFTDTFPPLNIQFPPTPPVHSPAAAFTNSPTYVNTELVDSAQLQSRQQTWPHPVVTFDQSMGFVTSAPASIYEDPSQIQQANPCLPASPWVDEDEFRLFGLNNADLLPRNNMQNIR